MFPIPWFVVLLVSIPESFLVIILGFRLFDIKISVVKAALISLIYGACVILLSYVNIGNGLHTVILGFITVLLCILFSQKNPWQVIAAVLSALAIVGVIQSTYLPICCEITSISAKNFILNPWLKVYFFIPEALFLITIYLAVIKSNFSVSIFKRREPENETL